MHVLFGNKWHSGKYSNNAAYGYTSYFAGGHQIFFFFCGLLVMHMCVRTCACECIRERKKDIVKYLIFCVCVCVCVCVHARAHMHVRVCV
jgi:hypothetical protein